MYWVVDAISYITIPCLQSFFLMVLQGVYLYIDYLSVMQLDGRPMSGDIGMGATKAAISLGSHVAASLDRPPGMR